MKTITMIFMYIDLIIGAIVITAGIITLALNLIVYLYESWIGFGTFRKFLRKYHNEMKKEKVLKADASVAFSKKEDNLD